MGLGGVPHQAGAVDLGDRLLDEPPPAQQVEVPHPQRRQFRPAQPAVAEHQDGGPAGPGDGERFQLLGGQVPAALLLHRGQGHAERGVDGQAPVAHREAEDAGQLALDPLFLRQAQPDLWIATPAVGRAGHGRASGAGATRPCWASIQLWRSSAR